jgi:hypothetical protein
MSTMLALGFGLAVFATTAYSAGFSSDGWYGTIEAEGTLHYCCGDDGQIVESVKSVLNGAENQTIEASVHWTATIPNIDCDVGGAAVIDTSGTVAPGSDPATPAEVRPFPVAPDYQIVVGGANVQLHGTQTCDASEPFNPGWGAGGFLGEWNNGLEGAQGFGSAPVPWSVLEGSSDFSYEASPFGLFEGTIKWHLSRAPEADVVVVGIGRAPWLPNLLYPLTGVVDFVVKNEGASAANDVHLTGAVAGVDGLHAAEIDRFANGCSVASLSFACSIGTLSPGDSVRIGLAVSPSSAGDSIVNGSAQATTSSPEQTTSNNEDSLFASVIADVSSPLGNGCGPSVAPQVLVNFASAMGVMGACLNHDDCYGGRVSGLLQPNHRWKTRLRCDNVLLKEGLRGCTQLSRLLKPGGQSACQRTVVSFHGLIRVFGGSAFRSARTAACQALYPNGGNALNRCKKQIDRQAA